MTEPALGLLAAANLGALALACWAYQYGGRTGTRKAWRRWGASSLLGAALTATALALGRWSPWHLLAFPGLVLGFSLGYGGDTEAERVSRRAVVVAASLSLGLLYVLTLGAPALWLFAAHGLVASASMLLGLRTPLHAAAEEVWICATLCLCLLAYPFVR